MARIVPAQAAGGVCPGVGEGRRSALFRDGRKVVIFGLNISYPSGAPERCGARGWYFVGAPKKALTEAGMSSPMDRLARNAGVSMKFHPICALVEVSREVRGDK